MLPSEQYRRARDELTAAAAVVLQAVDQLDADEAFVAGAEIEQLCDDLLTRVDDAIAHRPFPRTRIDVATGDRV